MNNTITISLKNIALILGVFFVAGGFYFKYGDVKQDSGNDSSMNDVLGSALDSPGLAEPLQIELSDYVNADGQQVFLITITNRSTETIAIPEHIRFSHYIGFSVGLGSHVRGAGYIGPRGDVPEASELRLVPLNSMDSVTTHWKLEDVMNFPHNGEFWHVRVSFFVPPVESKLPGMKTWSGAISSDWIHFAPVLREPLDPS